MRRAILAGLLLMAGPAWGQDAVALRQATVACYDRQAARLDDGISDAKTIAFAVSLECAEEERAEFMRLPGASPAAVSKAMDATKEITLARATGVVLARRVKVKGR